LSLGASGAERGLVAHWRINGYRATIHVWPDQVFRALAAPPADAQYYECGVWCALRLDD
jgi:hypothetical protein